MTTTNYLTTSQAAEILHVHPKTVTAWLRTGKLKGGKLPGERGQWRTTRAAVEEFLNEWEGWTREFDG